jgi:hypothetical protein
MGRVLYCTREEVADAFDVREAAHRSAQIDSAIASASNNIDGWLNRHRHGLAPQYATRYFNWPFRNYSQPWRLWLDENELISVTTLTSAGVAIPSTDYFLEPVNSGPPFTYVEIDQSSSASFSNDGTAQRALSILGLWGYSDEQASAGLLSAAVVSTTATTVDVTDSFAIGVGSLLKVDSERLIVTAKSSLTTGQVLVSAMDVNKADVVVDVADGTQLHVGETILIDSERMKIVDIAGNNVTVVRAHDGSVLAAHLLGATIYAPRRLTVERAAQGSTAATHLISAPVTKWVVPDLVRQLARAEAITSLEQEFSAYGVRVYSDEAERDSSGTEVVSGRGLSDLRKSCARAYKRKFRKAAV